MKTYTNIHADKCEFLINAPVKDFQDKINNIVKLYNLLSDQNITIVNISDFIVKYNNDEIYEKLKEQHSALNEDFLKTNIRSLPYSTHESNDKLIVEEYLQSHKEDIYKLINNSFIITATHLSIYEYPVVEDDEGSYFDRLSTESKYVKDGYKDLTLFDLILNRYSTFTLGNIKCVML
jgi:hypothetical protein